jgi:hypothetical protein
MVASDPANRIIGAGAESVAQASTTATTTIIVDSTVSLSAKVPITVSSAVTLSSVAALNEQIKLTASSVLSFTSTSSIHSDNPFHLRPSTLQLTSTVVWGIVGPISLGSIGSTLGLRSDVTLDYISRGYIGDVIGFVPVG